MTHGMHFGGESIPFLRPTGFFVQSTRWIAELAITLCVIASLFLMPLPMQAQVGTGDILGTVTDSSGAVIPGAKVIVKNAGTAAQRIATSNDKGEFTFSTLPNGTYTMTVEMKGFKTYVASGLPLSTGDRARFDVKMATGAVTETVEVTGVAAVMQTDSSEVSSTVDEKSVADLPLNGRSLESAIQVQPGITYSQNGNSSQDRRPSFAIAAAQGGSNNEMVDGFDNNERASGLDGVRPSVDSVQEVKIDTSSFSAEYGRASGAVINIITKAGTNTFHGSAYEFIRNDIFDAQFYDFGFPVAKAKLRQNYYGGSVGGPVWIPKLYNGKNKTFFFVDYERYVHIGGIQSNPVSIPTLYEQQEMASSGNLDICDVATTASGAYSALSETDCKVLSANVDPIMKNYFLTFPKPNYGTIGNGTLNYVSNPPEEQRLYNLDVRIDQHIGNNDILFGRYEADPTTTIEPEEFPQITEATIAQGIYSSAAKPFIGIYPGGYGTGFTGPAFTKTYGLQLDEVHIFSQNLLMELKAGYTRINIQSLPWNYDTGAAAKIGWNSSLDTGKVLPAIGGPFAAWSALLGSSNSLPIIDVNNTYQYAGSVTYTRGTHNFKIGAGMIRRQINYLNDAIAGGFFFNVGSDNTSFSGPSFLLPYKDDRLNFISGNPFAELRSNSANGGYRASEPSLYVLDNWRVSSKLTLNLGLRWDIYTPFTESHNNYSNFLPSCLTSAAPGADCWIEGKTDARIGVKVDYKDIQPRIGFAYSLDSKTVVRGAFGMTYFTPDTGLVAIGSGAPASIMQNINPQQSFNIGFKAFPYGPFCTISGNGVGGGNTGCIDNGPDQPVYLTTTEAAAFASNSSISAVSAKSTDWKNQNAKMVNLAVQRQFGNNTVTAAYVGSFSRNGLRSDNLNVAPLPGNAWVVENTTAEQYDIGNYAQHPYAYASTLPYMNTIAYLHNGAYSNYNALQVIYDRSFSQGLHLSGNYTWGHSLSNAWGDNIPSEPGYLQYGGRPTQRVAVNASYELPFGKNLKGVASVLAKGWKINAITFWQTGSSMTVTSSGGVLAVSGVTTFRPNMLLNPKRTNKSTTEWFNSCTVTKFNNEEGNLCSAGEEPAWDNQLPGTYGNEHVGQLIGPPARSLDLSISKEFPIFERLKGQFRAESFNLTNTPNFGNPNITMGSNQFGQISTITVAPRTLQFAMKLLF